MNPKAMKPKAVLELLKQSFNEWSEDKVPRLAAALAYYTVFSLAPLLIIVIAIVSLVYADANTKVAQQLASLVGSQGAGAIQQMIAGGNKHSSGIIATIIGIVTLLFGAAGVFGALQDALNTIWEVQPKPGLGIMATLKQRFLSFTMVLGTGFLLLVSLVISTILAGITAYFQHLLPGVGFIWQVVNFLISVAVATGIFMLIYKVIPDAKIAWRDVWIGALVTALLFTIGQLLIGLYLGRSTTSSAYGAAGSLVILLLWVYYSAQILFFGAEFTQVYAKTYGSKIMPASNAIPLTEEAREQQGIPRQEDVKAAARTGGRSVEGARVRRQTGTVPATQSASAAPAPTSALVGFFAGLLVGMRRKSKH